MESTCMLADVDVSRNMNLGLGNRLGSQIHPRTAAVIMFDHDFIAQSDLAAGFTRPLAKIHVFKVHPEIFVEPSDLQESFFAYQQDGSRYPVRKLDISRKPSTLL